jgi:glycosyltransferase involved in cell wall biosynthesis
MWKGKSITLVLPAYNEENNILEAVEDFFSTGVLDEILVIDNNSQDRTAELVRTFSKARLVSETRQGYGSALIRGLKEASMDLVILAEPDGTFVGQDIFKLLAYSHDFDMVMGTRTSRLLIWSGANMAFSLRFGNIAVAKILEFLFNTPQLTDCGCTLRLVCRDRLQLFLEKLQVTQSHFLPEMVIRARQAGLSMIEIPVNYRSRVGESKITGTLKGAIKTGARMLGLILKMRLSGGL